MAVRNEGRAGRDVEGIIQGGREGRQAALARSVRGEERSAVPSRA